MTINPAYSLIYDTPFDPWFERERLIKKTLLTGKKSQPSHMSTVCITHKNLTSAIQHRQILFQLSYSNVLKCNYFLDFLLLNGFNIKYFLESFFSLFSCLILFLFCVIYIATPIINRNIQLTHITYVTCINPNHSDFMHFF